jgi:hypothetical protein
MVPLLALETKIITWTLNILTLVHKTVYRSSCLSARLFVFTKKFVCTCGLVVVRWILNETHRYLFRCRYPLSASLHLLEACQALHHLQWTRFGSVASPQSLGSWELASGVEKERLLGSLRAFALDGQDEGAPAKGADDSIPPSPVPR